MQETNCATKNGTLSLPRVLLSFFSQRPREQLENLEVGDGLRGCEDILPIRKVRLRILLKKHAERKVRHPRNTKRHWKKISENHSFFLQKSIQFLSITFRKGTADSNFNEMK